MVNYSNYAKVDRISNPTDTEFNENYARKSLPVVIEGMMDNWNAKVKWTPEFFKNEFGDIEQLAVRNYDRNDKKLFKIRDYFNYIENCSDKDPYYLKNSQFHLNTEMIKDYNVPSFFKNKSDIIKKKWPKVELSWMYIGAKNTFSALHIDIFNTSAWNAVVSGKKVWFFYPPDQAKYLSAGINPFDPDLVKYPEFAQATPLVCVQKPGEVVFTPGEWLHAVYNEEGGVSITENFVNDINLGVVKKSLQEHIKNRRKALLKAPVVLIKKWLKMLLGRK